MSGKRILYLLAGWCGLAMVLVAWAACGKSKSYPDITFSTVKVEKRILLTEGDAPSCVFSLALQYAASPRKEVNERINQVLVRELLDEDSLSPKAAVDTFVTRYAGMYTTQTASLYQHEQKTAETRKWYSFSYKLSTQVEEGGDGILCYLSDFTKYEGGPEEYHSKRWLNFSKETGKRIVLGDILKPGYEPALDKLLLAALMEKRACQTEQALHAAGYLNNAEMYPSDNYLIKDHALVFLYHAGEIAPSDKGEIELTISLDDLEDWLKKTE